MLDASATFINARRSKLRRSIAKKLKAADSSNAKAKARPKKVAVDGPKPDVNQLVVHENFITRKRPT